MDKDVGSVGIGRADRGHVADINARRTGTCDHEQAARHGGVAIGVGDDEITDAQHVARIGKITRCINISGKIGGDVMPRVKPLA